MADALTVDIEKRFSSGARIGATLATSLVPGGILVLFGPSGSGKTTLIRSVAGLERPDRGVIRFGRDTWFDAGRRAFVAPQRRRVGLVFQDAALLPHLTVRRNVDYGTQHAGSTAHATLGSARLLERLGLTDLAERSARQLSGGEAQRVALARALAPAPRLLLLDEPFAALDVPARTALRQMLRALIEELRVPAILVTHDRSDAMALGDQMAVLAEGAVRQIGPVLDVFRRPADLIVARAVGVDSVVPARVERLDQGLVELGVGETTLRAVGEVESHREVFACIRAEDVTIERGQGARASARNHLPATVIRVESDGPLDRVALDCGFPLTALITRSAREELDLSSGEVVTAVVKATAIHLVPRV
jgi:molybdate transport system ATP-binding protein